VKNGACPASPRGLAPRFRAGVSAWIACTAAAAQPVVVKTATLVPNGSSWYQILKEMPR
jgi:hypothetical protein